jgi:hypothetical protein
MRDLPFYRYRDEIEQIMTAEQQQWQSSWDPAMRTHPESRSADYDILVNSKSYFLYNASLIPELQGAVFAWIDAGYGTRQDILKVFYRYVAINPLNSFSKKMRKVMLPGN